MVDLQKRYDALIKEENTNRKEKSRQDKSSKYMQIVTLVFVILTTVGVFIQAGILHNSDIAFQDTAIAARAANEIAIRPYIKVSISPSSFAMRSRPTGGKPVMAIQFNIEDIGKLPALARAEANVDWEMEGRSLPKNFGPTGNMGQIFLFPQDNSGNIIAYGAELNEGDLINLKNAKHGSVFVTVSILYGPDNDSARYETRICTVYPTLIEDNAIRLDRGERCPQDGSNYAK
jgi:hypothetical protein